MPFEKGKQVYKHETPWISGEGRKITKKLPPALIKAFNGLTNEGKAFGLRCERLALLNQDELNCLDGLLDALGNGNRDKLIEALDSFLA